MSQNPYAPPVANVADGGQGGVSASTPLAGLGARFANLLLDWLFAWLFTMLCAFIAGMVMAALGNTTWYENAAIAQLLGIVFFTSYYLVFEAAFGWTVAKLLTGTRVVNRDGRKPAFMSVLGRSLARSVPFEPFSFFGKTGVGWHDRWSGTRVVSVRRTSGATLADSFLPDFRRP